MRNHLTFKDLKKSFSLLNNIYSDTQLENDIESIMNKFYYDTDFGDYLADYQEDNSHPTLNWILERAFREGATWKEIKIPLKNFLKRREERIQQ